MRRNDLVSPGQTLNGCLSCFLQGVACFPSPEAFTNGFDQVSRNFALKLEARSTCQLDEMWRGELHDDIHRRTTEPHNGCYDWLLGQFGFNRDALKPVR